MTWLTTEDSEIAHVSLIGHVVPACAYPWCYTTNNTVSYLAFSR
jgi:hypothetical protein